MPTPARISPALCTQSTNPERVFTDPDEPAASPIPPAPVRCPSPETCNPFAACAWPPRGCRSRRYHRARARGHGHDVPGPAGHDEPRRRLVRVRGSRAATEPVEARKDGLAPAVDQADQEAGLLAPEELEVLEAAAITGDDEGRRPTDCDRRAHIFEESSRVFRELKQRSDGGGSESGRGGVTTTGATATAAETRACNEQQQ